MKGRNDGMSGVACIYVDTLYSNRIKSVKKALYNVSKIFFVI